jgi:AcrR family transcriptional regulator
MSSKARRVREKAALKQEILNAARDLFVQDGYENVSMRRIAEKIDYSPTTVYLHFVDKADLLFHICEQTFAKLVAQGDKLVAQKIDPLTKLKMFGRAYIEFGLKHPDHYKLTFMVQHEPGELEERYETSMGHRAFELLRLCVEECILKGVFRRIDLSQTSQALWAGVHGITSLLIARPDFPWVEKDQTIDLLVDSLCDGFAQDESKPGAVKSARRSGNKKVSTNNSTTLNSTTQRL